MKTILVPTDLSDVSEYALDVAVEIAKKQGATVVLLKKIIFLYIFTMPIGFVIEFKYWAVPIVTLVFYIFASIEVIAEEIENPFGSDANDLPVDSIISNIDKNTNEIFGITKV